MGDTAETLGDTTLRAQKSDENNAGDAAKTPDDKTVDVYLNDAAYWNNIPGAIWNYKLGGYQVLKKWLSYREHKILNRPLKPRRSPTLHQHRPPHRGDFGDDGRVTV